MLSWTTAYIAAEWVIRIAMLVYVPQRRTPAAARPACSCTTRGSSVRWKARYIAASRVLDPTAWAARPLGQQVVQNSARLADSLQ